MIADDSAAPRASPPPLMAASPPGRSGPSLEVMLELQDQIIGIQAQLDEMHARIDAFEQRMGGGRRPLARVRSGARRLRGSVGRRSQPST